VSVELPAPLPPEALAALAGLVVHDLNNLLTVIVGNVAFLRQAAPPDAPWRPDVDAIEQAADEATALLAHLTDTTVERAVEPARLDVGEVVRSLGGRLRGVIGGDVDLEISLPSRAQYAEADRSQLERIVLALALQGRWALPEGGTVAIGSESADAVGFVVTARGPAVDLTRSRVALLAAEAVVSHLGGQLAMEEHPDEVRFLTRLPAARSGETVDPEREWPQPAAGSGVLLVEKDPPVRTTAARALREAGFRVLEAAGGAEGLSLARGLPEVRVVVTGLVTADLSGCELLERMTGDGQSLPVLFLAGGGEEVLLACSRLSAAAVLRKPFRPEELVREVSRLATAHPAREEAARGSAGGGEAGMHSRPPRLADRILEHVARGAPLGETLTLLATAIEQHVPGSRCSILLLDHAAGTLTHGAAPSLPDAYCRAIDGVSIGPDVGSCGTAAFLGAPVITTDIALDERWRDYRHLALPHGLRSCWSSPIVNPATGAVLGTFALYRGEVHSPDEEEQTVVEQFTHLAAVAIDNTWLLTALRESEERFRRTFEDTSVGMALVDLEGRYLQVNEALARLLGRTPSDLTGADSEVLVHPEDRERLRAARRSLTEGALSGHHEEERYVRPDGCPLWAEVARTLIRNAAGRPLYYCEHVIDITERKRAQADRQARRLAEAAREAAERASRHKSEFLGRLNHEVRTPLNAILGFTQLLHLSCSSETQRQNLAHILQAGNHLAGVIDDALDLARVEAGRLRLRPEAVRVSGVVEEAVELILPLARQRRVRLDAATAGAGEVVLADRQRLRQVLINLLSNGIKYNREGGQVRVSSCRLTPSRVAIAVSDNGPGIPPDALDRLFVPFERLDADTGDIEGSGLGLAVSKALVEAMGGSIEVDSRPGQGSTFRIELKSPGAPSAGRPPGRPAETAAEPAESRRRNEIAETVVYVEDDPASVDLVRSTLALRPNVRLATASSEGRCAGLPPQAGGPHRPARQRGPAAGR
jgi:PAS domain S-box-containing protein